MDNWPSWPLTLAALTVLYLLGLLFYRLTLHPLARFPGPRWTAITRYYEGYFDVIKDGQYTFKIAEMHRRYGQIVRISPYEVHISDPAFFDLLYRQDGHYDKSRFAFDAFAAYGATLFTVSHDVHKARRQVLNPYFSKARVASQQDLIHRHLDKLCQRLSNLADSNATFDLGAATTALARDVSNDFVLGKSYNSLDRDDFDVVMLDMSQGGGSFWRVGKFVRWVGPLMQSLPVDWVIKMADGPMKTFFRHLKETQGYIREVVNGATSLSSDMKGRRSVIHEILDSKLPEFEKKFQRVYEDASTMTGAGFETTASATRLILFHTFSNAKLLHQLRAEITAAGTSQPLDLKILEQLPRLTATLMEGLRLSPAIATRMARVSKSDIFYDSWRIPAGTAIGMTLILMHTDERLYPEPKLFNPDRWLNAGVLKRNEPGFAPFSKGTRNCIGMHLAWAEMYMTVAEMVRRFDFTFVDAKAGDFECVSDQFAVGTPGLGHVKAVVRHHRD